MNASSRAGSDPSDAMTTPAHHQAQRLCLPGVFDNIDISKSEALYNQLLGMEFLWDTNILRFFDFMANNATPELSVAQMAHHLTVLVALGSTVNETLVSGDYAWVLQSDASTSDKPEADNLYQFFGNPVHARYRSAIWSQMLDTGFVTSTVIDISKPRYYTPRTELYNLVSAKTAGINIVIGGNSIPDVYQQFDPKSQNNFGALDVCAYPSSRYAQCDLDAINIGVDHRHRPDILANALDANLWRGIEAHRISNIYVDQYSDLSKKLKAILPESLKSKVIEAYL